MTNKFRILIEEKKAAAVSKRGPRVYEKPEKKETINWRKAKPEERDAHLIEKKWKEQERALGRAAKYC
jgi:hypothetical protein